MRDQPPVVPEVPRKISGAYATRDGAGGAFMFSGVATRTSIDIDTPIGLVHQSVVRVYT